jgi:hypothetical protein
MITIHESNFGHGLIYCPENLNKLLRDFMHDEPDRQSASCQNDTWLIFTSSHSKTILSS